jgi:hypothetical protein
MYSIKNFEQFEDLELINSFDDENSKEKFLDEDLKSTISEMLV